MRPLLLHILDRLLISVLASTFLVLEKKKRVVISQCSSQDQLITVEIPNGCMTYLRNA